jgi:phosphohistidine swiveling domain-containing protein
MTIIDLHSPPQDIDREIVGNKFFNLYLLNQLAGVKIPPAFCVTEPEFDKVDLLRKLEDGKKYAIRSSASIEDTGNYSAAGIFKSFLNLSDPEEIIEAIHDCFNSCRLPEARRYFTLREINDASLHMSVIIQDMIDSEKSGILFTENPLNGNKEFLIEYSTGLGNHMFSATARPKFSVLHQDDKPDDPVLFSLLDVAKEIENFYESPQDIEWTWSQGQLYILQARPLVAEITRIYQPREVWTRANIGEIIPRPLTPLSWDIFSRVISNSYRYKYYSIFDRIITNMFHRLPRSQPVVRAPQNFFGVMYLNLETVLRSFGSEPGVDAHVLEAGLGFQIPHNIARLKFSIFDHMALTLKKFLYILELIFPAVSMEKKILPFISSQPFLQPSRDLKTPEALIKINQFLLGWHIAMTARSFSHLGFLLRLSRIFKKYRLNINRIVSLLSREKSDPYFREFKALLRNRESAQEKGQGAGSLGKDDLLNGFLEKFGHRSENEFELSQPSWGENPGVLEKLMGVSPASSTESEPEVHLPFWGRKILNRMAFSIEQREQLKSLQIKNYREFRYLYLQKGEELQKKSLMKSKEDIFFLTAEEIMQIEDKEIRYVSRLIKRRKEEFQRNSRQRIPFTLFGDMSPEQFLPFDFNGRIIRGIGCSEGVVAGRAVVMGDYDDSVLITENDIVVTISADPGWIPLLLNCAGMITEMGGILSHICTIARENDKPIVVGVKGATEYIKNGQTISIDGSNGMVILTEYVNSF